LDAKSDLSSRFAYGKVAAHRTNVILALFFVAVPCGSGGGGRAGCAATPAIATWNLFGAADLVLAIAFRITSAEGSPLQLFPGHGSFVPTVLVPIWLVLHAIIAVQLQRAKLGQAATAVAGGSHAWEPAS
jgi:hypothetical protein